VLLLSRPNAAPAPAKDSSRVAAPHLQPDRPLIGDEPTGLGYGYQWWLLDGDRGEFSAIGVYNQFVYVDPTARTTIVKLSANRTYGTSIEEAANREAETIAFLRAVARHTN
jgi:CubicO group peptidase (beta-lactamase class C family)